MRQEIKNDNRRFEMVGIMSLKFLTAGVYNFCLLQAWQEHV